MLAFLYRYLLIPNVLAAASGRKCTMLHPGYGFLAENAVFVEMCREHGINFIGPNVSRLDLTLHFL
jgi:acetyl-CoA carboxylase biotin carboxylase subunit